MKTGLYKRDREKKYALSNRLIDPCRTNALGSYAETCRRVSHQSLCPSRIAFIDSAEPSPPDLGEIVGQTYATGPKKSAVKHCGICVFFI